MIVPLPLPPRQPETIDLTRDDVEDEQEQFFPEMMSARETSSCRDDERTDMDKKQKLIFCSLQASGQDADVDAGLNVALRVLDIQKVKSNELARNKKFRDEVFRTLAQTGYISQPAVVSI